MLEVQVTVMGRNFKLKFDRYPNRKYQLGLLNGNYRPEKWVVRDITQCRITEINSAGHVLGTFLGESSRKPSDVSNPEVGRLYALRRALHWVYGPDANREVKTFIRQYIKKIGLTRNIVDFLITCLDEYSETKTKPNQCVNCRCVDNSEVMQSVSKVTNSNVNDKE